MLYCFCLLVKKVDDILIVCFVLVNLEFDYIKESNVDFDDKEFQYINGLIRCYIFKIYNESDFSIIIIDLKLEDIQLCEYMYEN